MCICVCVCVCMHVCEFHLKQTSYKTAPPSPSNAILTKSNHSVENTYPIPNFKMFGHSDHVIINVQLQFFIHALFSSPIFKQFGQKANHSMNYLTSHLNLVILKTYSKVVIMYIHFKR